jgi:ABC-2 type transport system ATP-binding protein
MKKLGKRRLTLHLREPLSAIPPELAAWKLELDSGGQNLIYTVDGDDMDVSTLLQRMSDSSISIKDLQTHQSSLEDIFVSLVSTRQ